MNFWDAHSHLLDRRLDSSRQAAMTLAIRLGITNFWICGFEPSDWKKQIQFKSEWSSHARITTSFGLHPWWVAEKIRGQIAGEKNLSDLPAMITEELEHLECEIPHADTLGELGLDFHPRHFLNLEHKEQKAMARAMQEQVFARQLQIASHHQKPIVLHIVRAHPQAIVILTAHAQKTSQLRGLVHSFGADLQTARKYLALGLTLSISASIFKDTPAAATTRQAIAAIELSDFVLETDSPDQFVALPRAEPAVLSPSEPALLNQPAQILSIAAAVAHIKSTTPQKVLEASRSNLLKLLNL